MIATANWLANGLELGLQNRDVGASLKPVKQVESVDVPNLTRRMRDGDEEAYRVFYAAYFDRLWRYLLVVTGGNEDASREALQSALVRVVRHIKVMPSEEVLWGWLTVVARSALSDQSRKRRRYLAFLDRFTLHAMVEESIAEVSTPDSTLMGLLEQNLANLSSEERELVESKYISGRSAREIAEELQTSEKAIESRLVRVRRKLKNALLEGLKHE